MDITKLTQITIMTASYSRLIGQQSEIQLAISKQMGIVSSLTSLVEDSEIGEAAKSQIEISNSLISDLTQQLDAINKLIVTQSSIAESLSIDLESEMKSLNVDPDIT